MATLSHSDSRRLYSWWWDSHISPKNSKWLQEDLTDMDAKVKAMIKLIEEDADSFARRAEMYYKKRPELIKLVEEFYRAYRALAERYDHATGELRHAHRTMAQAFPNQASFVLTEDSSQGTEPHTPEMSHPIRAFIDTQDFHKDVLGLSESDLHSVTKNESNSGASDTVISEKGLKQLYEMFESGDVVMLNSKSAEGKMGIGLNQMQEKEDSLHDEVSKLSNENHNLKTKVLSESERAGKAECEVQNLKKGLTDMQAEKESLLLQYRQSLEKLSSLEEELNCAETESRRFNEKVKKAESEVFMLKEAIIKLETERDAGYIKNREYLERITNLELMISRAHEDAKGLDGRTIKAEIEAQYLKNELSRIKSEQKADLLQYKQCLEKISDLEKKVFIAEEDAQRCNHRAEKAETEVKKLNKALTEISSEKEAAALRYKLCLEKISKLESEISYAQEKIRRLNCEILTGTTKLRTAEDKCDLLVMSNKSLQLEADNLAKNISLKDKELSEKHEELEKLQICVQDERSRYAHVESTLQTLQNLHAQSQEDQRTLALELKNGLQMLKDLEICKYGLEDEMCQIKDENRSLKELNTSSTMSMRDLQNEILGFTRVKERLQEEVTLQLGHTNSLQQEILGLKEEIKGLNRSYQALIEQVELVGLNPKCFGLSVKELQDKNSRLRQICENDKDEKETLLKKLVNMEEILGKNAALQSSLSDVNSELEGSQEKVRALQESFHILDSEKSALFAEKAALLSQLQIVTECMHKLLEKNAILENSLCSANIELEGLRGKSKSLEEICQLLRNEKANLLNERSALSGQLEIVERRLDNLENRFTEFEEKYADLEKEKDSIHYQVKELRASLGIENQEQENLAFWSEFRLASLENHVHFLQEESRWKNKEFQEELDKGVIAQFEIFILQKFIEDVEEKNYYLLIECQKQIEASRLAEKLISELENESLEQQVEAELLLVEIEKLRSGMHKVFKVLAISPDSESEEHIEKEQIFMHPILEYIEDMKTTLSQSTDDKQQLVVENSVLLTLIGQLRLVGVEVELEKKNLDQGLKNLTEQLLMVQREKHDLLEMNRQLRSEVSKGDHHANVLLVQVESLNVKQAEMQRAYLKKQEEYSKILEQNRSLLNRSSDLKEEKCNVEEENNVHILEALYFDNLSTIFKSFGTENAVELKLLSDDLHNLHAVNIDLANQMRSLTEKLGTNETKNLCLKNLIEELEMKLSGVKDLNTRLKQEISSGKDILSSKEKELSDAEQKLVTTENLNSELCRTVEGLKREYEKSEFKREKLETEILELSAENMNQKKEIQCLYEVKRDLESELVMLNEDIEERRIREENLNSELQEKNNEFELWDAEATSFYFELQLSAIRDVLFENKVHELTGLCESLKDESASKTQEIEQIRERVDFKDSEIGELKSQLLAYSHVIVSLKDSIESLEHSMLSRAKLIVADSQTPKVHPHEKSCQESLKDQKYPIPDGIFDLLKLQSRIKAFEKVVVEEMIKLERQESSSANIEQEAAMRETEKLKSECDSFQGEGKREEEKGLWDEPSDNSKVQKTKPELPEVRCGILMKDIPLDQASDSSSYGISKRRSSQVDDQTLELLEATDKECSHGQNPNGIEDHIAHHHVEDVEWKNGNPSSELEMEKELGVDKLLVSTCLSMPNQGGKKTKILQRLASDAQKLANIQTTVQDLRRKLETNKKSRKAKNVDVEMVKEQLQEVEEAVVQLFDLNGQMSRKIEEIPFSLDGKASSEFEEVVSVQKRRISEQARKESEKIGRLQLEIQKIQYVLLKLEDENKSKGKNQFSRTKSRTSIILRDFIHNGKRSSIRRQKGRLCGCFRPSTSNAFSS